MIHRAIKEAAAELDKVAQAARSGQLTLLLDEADKPIAYVGSGLCSRGELTSAILATRPACPGEVRIERGKLGRQWQSVIQRVRERCVVIVTEGRVLAGIVADDGPAGQGAIGTESSAYAERNRAILAGREVQITRRHQVVARIIPPSRIAEFLPGWRLPEPEPQPRRKPSPEERRRQIALRGELREMRRRDPRRSDYDDTIAPVPASIDDILGE